MSEGASLPIIDSPETQSFITARYSNKRFWLGMTLEDNDHGKGDKSTGVGSASGGGGGQGKGGRWNWVRADGTKQCVLKYKNWKRGALTHKGVACATDWKTEQWTERLCDAPATVLCQMPGEKKIKGKM